MKLLITSLLLISTAFSVFYNPQESGKKLLYEDATYEEEIRTVLLYPDRNYPGDVFKSPVGPVGPNTLTLEFDDLVEAHEQYKVKFIHCNSNWKPSGLRPLDYLYEFNEYNIRQYEYSTDTKIGYIHYTFKLPSFKVSGNYLLIAYRGTNENDVILTKRFMIYSPSVEINIQSNLNGLTSMRRNNQQIDFNIDYENYELINPLDRIRVILRQNQQWYNIITLIKPSFLREHSLEYRFFNFENNFSAGNEYRFFDMRSLRYPGQNISKIDLLKRPSEAIIMTEKPRIYQAYAQYDDINGNFYIKNLDTGGSSESDYLYTTFNLVLKEPIGGSIHVLGKMNDNKLDATTEMKLDDKTNQYTNTQLLKQGFYNYKYVVKSDTLDYNYLEGNHFETENDYEIFVYYTPPNLRGDLLIGYKEVTINERPN